MARIPALLFFLIFIVGAETATAKPVADGDALFKAAEQGKLSVVVKYLEGGGSVNAADKASLSLLNWAAYGGSLALVKLLVDKKADVNVHGNKSGWTPLMNASAMGFPLVAAYLLDRGAELNRLNEEGYNALAFAAAKQRVDVVHLLLERGADGGTAFVSLVRKNDAAALRLLLESGVDVNATPRVEEKWFVPGETGLYTAAETNNPELVSLLLEKGANADIATPRGGNMSTPLMMAAYFCNAAMIDALVAHNVTRGATNINGDTAAQLAETGWTNDMKPCAADIVAKLR